jgi:K+-sensing histidine kinase KdpD
VKASNSCAGTLIFSSFFFIVFCQSFFPVPFLFFLLSVLLSFLLLSNWFLFLSSFVFPLLFQHCFIPDSSTHVVSSLAYPNLLGTKRLGCWLLHANISATQLVSKTGKLSLTKHFTKTLDICKLRKQELHAPGCPYFRLH